MILKFQDISSISLNKYNLFLFYGKNEELKNQAIKKLNKNNYGVFNYEEKEILDNQDNFFENALTKSLFDDYRNIIIKRATDKILNIIENIYSRNFVDIRIIINAENLEKKSKLRSFFEKKKDTVCIAFYPDNEQTLSKLAYEFFKEKKILISQTNINLIVNKSLGDRKNLQNELKKIEQFCKNGKKLNSENITKIINLSENYSISELIDNCLAKNKKKIINILNENNYTNDDCILITRTFLNKSKRILKLCETYEKNNNINLTINAAKPPIFWKDKEITIKQLNKWKPKTLKKLIYKINDLELKIKTNFNNSINFITDFILEQSA